MSLPAHIHILQSIHRTGRLGAYHNNHSYVVGFVQRNDVVYASRHMTEESKVVVKHYHPTMTKIVNTEEGKMVMVYFEEPSIIRLEKKPSPQFDFTVESVHSESLLTLPIKNNIGIFITYKQTHETTEFIEYESFIIDPIVNLDMFRLGLSELHNDLP